MLTSILNWLQATPLSTTIREADWVFPAIESVHVIAFVLVVGSIGIVDVRLVGLGWKRRPAGDLIAALLPITWSAFVVAAIAGLLLFCGKPITYVGNGYFLAKMALLLLAGINMAVFHQFVHARLVAAGADESHPVEARLSGLASLVLWIAIVACGRWIGFTTL